MKSLYRYRKERRYEKPPEVIWPFVADTARINELSGSPVYQVEERPDAQGRIHRFGTAGLGPLRLRWEDGYSEWQENRRIVQVRDFQNGPMRRFQAAVELYPDGTGSRLVYSSDIELVGILGWLAKQSGQIDREGDKRLAVVEKLIAEAEALHRIPGSSDEPAVKPAARRRLEALIAELERDPASHGLAQKLVRLFAACAGGGAARDPPAGDGARLERGPGGHRRIVPRRAAARHSGDELGSALPALPRRQVECAATARIAGRRPLHVVQHRLPARLHPQCRIDFPPRAMAAAAAEGRAVPARPRLDAACALPGGSGRACDQESFAVTLPPGPYRFRTIEAGAEVDAHIADDGAIPEVVAWNGDILLRSPSHKGEFVIHNDTDRPLFFVIEDRAWAKDALTGERVISMPAFRRLCPEQLLRPGDEVEIGRVAIVFTDLQGSTKLYDKLGDAAAYRLVRDHFAFLSERVTRHHGFIVKTVGDAVMAAFNDPADAVRAVLAMQDEVASFNRGREDAGIVLKLGLHIGACIAVTAGEVLDYFGSTVNTASRLEHQCSGGEVIISHAVLTDPEAREALAGRHFTEDSATLRGLAEPVRFVRVSAGATAGDVAAALG